MSSAQQLAQFQMIDLTKLGESTFNPRKHFDEKKQAELNASVAAKGVLEPILVRPNGKVFEVVAGARRYRAALAAMKGGGPKEVLCVVRELTDVEALEVAIIENVERDDISAADEGSAYRDLVKLGRTVEEIVEKTGRSRTIVFARMKLAGLEGDPRKALDAGRMSASVAELLVRLPTVAMQEAAFEKLKKEAHYRYFESYAAERSNLSNVPVWHAKEILDAEFRLVLKKATFDVKDEKLVAGVVACGACPKRTGADKALFPGVKEDTCLDAACWKSKTSAATRQLKEEVLEHGKELVKITRLNDQYSPSKLSKPVAEKFSRPGEKVDGKNTWKDLLGSETPTVVALDKDNKTHNLVDKKKALELLRAKDEKAAEKVEKAATEPKEDDWEARQREEVKKRGAEKAAHRVIRSKALGAVTKIDAAVELLLASWTRDWQWQAALEEAGVPKGTKPEKLKPAQRVAILVSRALSLQSGYTPALDQAAKLVKLDVKKLTKKALATEGSGVCFACDKPAPEKANLCVACGGKEN